MAKDTPHHRRALRRRNHGLDVTYPQELVHEHIARSSRRHLHALAVRDNLDALTYDQLLGRSAQSAIKLAERGIGSADVVMIALPRCIDLVVTMLAVLRAGAAYCIIDPRWPSAWVRKVEMEVTAVALLTSRDGFLQIDCTEKLQAKGKERGKAQSRNVNLDEPFCVYHTSGTTGKAKAVVTSHRGVLRTLLAPSYPTVLDPLVFACTAALPWDMFTMEVWFPLIHGGACVLIEEPTPQAISSQGLTTMWLTAARFNALVEEDIDCFKEIQEVLIGGERLSVVHVRSFIERHQDIRLINGYGPAEANMLVTTHHIRAFDCERKDGIPLGVPLPGTEIQLVSRLVDGSLIASVEGEPGEIAISGDALSLGYIGLEHHGSSAFVCLDAKMNAVDESQRFYLTGDVGYWDSDDKLMFCGRSDRQLKIHGQRIDPHEVEQALLLTGLISQCAVTRQARDAVSSVLAAHIVPINPRSPFDTEALLLRLAEDLPSYKIPSAIVQLEHMPLSPTGKLDYKALQLPARNQSSHPPCLINTLESSLPTTPHNQKQNALVVLIIETACLLMETNELSMDDDLMLKGLDSLGAFRLACRMSKKTTVSILTSDIILERTARRIAAVSSYRHASSEDVRRHETRVSSLVKSGETEWPTPWLQSQWLSEMVAPQRHESVLVGSAFRFCGLVDKQELCKALDTVIRRHDILRTIVRSPTSTGHFRSSLIPPASAIYVDQIDVVQDFMNLEEVQTHMMTTLRHVDVSKGPIIAATILTEEKSTVLLFGTHHLVLDGHSEALLMREINSLLIGEALSPVIRPYLSVLQHEEDGTFPDAWAKRLSTIPTIKWPAKSFPHTNLTYGLLSIEQTSQQWGRVMSKKAPSESEFLFVLRIFGTAIRHLVQQSFRLGIGERGRDSVEVDSTLGNFFRFLPVPMDNTTFQSPVDGVARAWESTYRNRNVPLSTQLSQCSASTTSRGTFLQTALVWQNVDMPRWSIPDVQVETLEVQYLAPIFDVYLELKPLEDGGVKGFLEYDPQSVKLDVAETILSLFLNDA